MIRSRLAAAFVTFAVVFAASPALAAGGGKATWSMTFFAFVNFGIFCLIIKKFAWPLVADYLQSRRLETLQALEAAAEAKREAESMKAEFERKMASLEEQAAKAREEILEIARREAEKAVAHAEETAARLKRDAQLLAEQEVARARRELQDESAHLIAKVAGEIVAQEITDDDQKRFVDEFVKETSEAAS